MSSPAVLWIGLSQSSLHWVSTEQIHANVLFWDADVCVGLINTILVTEQ